MSCARPPTPLQRPYCSRMDVRPRVDLQPSIDGHLLVSSVFIVITVMR